MGKSTKVKRISTTQTSKTPINKDTNRPQFTRHSSTNSLLRKSTPKTPIKEPSTPKNKLKKTPAGTPKTTSPDEKNNHWFENKKTHKKKPTPKNKLNNSKSPFSTKKKNQDITKNFVKTPTKKNQGVDKKKKPSPLNFSCLKINQIELPVEEKRKERFEEEIAILRQRVSELERVLKKQEDPQRVNKLDKVTQTNEKDKASTAPKKSMPNDEVFWLPEKTSPFIKFFHDFCMRQDPLLTSKFNFVKQNIQESKNIFSLISKSLGKPIALKDFEAYLREQVKDHAEVRKLLSESKQYTDFLKKLEFKKTKKHLFRSGKKVLSSTKFPILNGPLEQKDDIKKNAKIFLNEVFKYPKRCKLDKDVFFKLLQRFLFSQGLNLIVLENKDKENKQLMTLEPDKNLTFLKPLFVYYQPLNFSDEKKGSDIDQQTVLYDCFSKIPLQPVFKTHDSLHDYLLSLKDQAKQVLSKSNKEYNKCYDTTSLKKINKLIVELIRIAQECNFIFDEKEFKSWFFKDKENTALLYLGLSQDEPKLTLLYYLYFVLVDRFINNKEMFSKFKSLIDEHKEILKKAFLTHLDKQSHEFSDKKHPSERHASDMKKVLQNMQTSAENSVEMAQYFLLHLLVNKGLFPEDVTSQIKSSLFSGNETKELNEILTYINTLKESDTQLDMHKPFMFEIYGQFLKEEVRHLEDKDDQGNQLFQSFIQPIKIQLIKGHPELNNNLECIGKAKFFSESYQLKDEDKDEDKKKLLFYTWSTLLNSLFIERETLKHIKEPTDFRRNGIVKKYAYDFIGTLFLYDETRALHLLSLLYWLFDRYIPKKVDGNEANKDQKTSGFDKSRSEIKTHSDKILNMIFKALTSSRYLVEAYFNSKSYSLINNVKPEDLEKTKETFNYSNHLDKNPVSRIDILFKDIPEKERAIFFKLIETSWAKDYLVSFIKEEMVCKNGELKKEYNQAIEKWLNSEFSEEHNLRIKTYILMKLKSDDKSYISEMVLGLIFFKKLILENESEFFTNLNFKFQKYCLGKEINFENIFDPKEFFSQFNLDFICNALNDGVLFKRVHDKIGGVNGLFGLLKEWIYAAGALSYEKFEKTNNLIEKHVTSIGFNAPLIQYLRDTKSNNVGVVDPNYFRVHLMIHLCMQLWGLFPQSFCRKNYESFSSSQSIVISLLSFLAKVNYIQKSVIQTLCKVEFFKKYEPFGAELHQHAIPLVNYLNTLIEKISKIDDLLIAVKNAEKENNSENNKNNSKQNFFSNNEHEKHVNKNNAEYDNIKQLMCDLFKLAYQNYPGFMPDKVSSWLNKNQSKSNHQEQKNNEVYYGRKNGQG